MVASVEHHGMVSDTAVFRASLGGGTRERVRRANPDVAGNIEIESDIKSAPRIIDMMPAIVHVGGVHLSITAVG